MIRAANENKDNTERAEFAGRDRNGLEVAVLVAKTVRVGFFDCRFDKYIEALSGPQRKLFFDQVRACERVQRKAGKSHDAGDAIETSHIEILFFTLSTTTVASLPLTGVRSECYGDGSEQPFGSTERRSTGSTEIKTQVQPKRSDKNCGW